MFERLRRRSASDELQFDSSSVLGLANVSPNLVAIAVDSRFALANPAAENILGEATPGGLIGRSVLDLIHADDRDRAAGLLAQIRETGQAPVWAGARMLAVDGRAIGFQVSITSVAFRGQRAAMLVGYDDREARRANEALVESQRRYQSLAAAAPVAIYRLDADAKCVDLNRRWSDLTGIPIDEALGRRWVDLVPDEYKAHALDVWGEIVTGPGEYRAEQTVHHRNGSTLQVLTQVVSETDADGRVIGWVGTLTDLTDLKETERALARSEARLRNALESASLVSWVADLDTGRIDWSENAASVLGLPEGALPTEIQEGLSFVSGSAVTFRAGRAIESLESGDPFEIEARFERAGEDPRWILARGQARAPGLGEGRRIVGVVADVTARRRDAEERAMLEQKLIEAQRLESLGLLAGGVAHDFNNLLVGILGNAELALTRLADDAPARALVEGIRDAGVRAAEIARQILAYSGSEPLARQPVDLSTLVRDTLGLLRDSLPSDARLLVRTPARPAFVTGDPTQLHQVLMNLLINAGESLPKGGGEVRVAIEHFIREAPDGAAPAAFLALDVVDSGTGMDAQTRARIFDPFYTTRANGRGLGLAVVHGIVRAHGGTIEVESEPGEGTRMRVLLPAASIPAKGPEIRRELASADAAEPPASALVLVIDDERAVREVMRVALESAGHRVLLAGTGAEARAWLAAHGRAIDAIVLDLSLGTESSESVLAEIRAHSADVPVLVTSGYPEEEAIGRLAALGVSAFVPKPFTPTRLNAGLSRVLNERRPATAS